MLTWLQLALAMQLHAARQNFA